MTNELEKQFFDTYGIEAKELEYPDNFAYYHEITDSILLQLICILNDLGASYLSYRFKRNINDLRQEILADLIFSLTEKTNANKKMLKHQVRTLFEEE